MDQLSHVLLDLSLKFAKNQKVKTEELENWNQDESHTAKNGERAGEIHPLLGEIWRDGRIELHDKPPTEPSGENVIDGQSRL